MEFIKRVIIDTVLFIALAGLFSNTGMFYVNSVGVALLASLVLAVLNVLVKPILLILSLPVNVLTLGLFSIVINALMLQLTSFFVGSFYFHFSSFGSAMLIAIIMSICNVVISDHINN
ncbi:phage holin family protein [Limosilactobacillus fastidiosus]|uniref:Phage holin family protein n=1 Tax=Limosilactobacillus fastidiosus TaxID=2759855 RepID=A0A7W3TZH2_9LACO|nr:phage holin family protein [Limosilactobacillus fastidiosus]MBB1063237.1 phage holin family protein [Limosilactobacillus fastidiosus]MBB1086122.1 phage holin family protein [Limosilactobacillus fastidiosus]MCD7084468.1 phage holin family protein [Limosilactobacillus fastidiosus]MCD7085037.1 phage holin family protein [Limosilactobacillus fastidiosus]MCD7114549.1 phage holin family protein [Limosilactobacillus fastidiosus]